MSEVGTRDKFLSIIADYFSRDCARSGLCLWNDPVSSLWQVDVRIPRYERGWEKHVNGLDAESIWGVFAMSTR